MPLLPFISGIFIFTGLKKKDLEGCLANRSDTVLYQLAVRRFIEVTFKLDTTRYANNGIITMNYLNLFMYKDRYFWYLKIRSH